MGFQLRGWISLLLVAVAFSLVVGCSLGRPDRFNADYPFALKVAHFRSREHAQSMKNQLHDLGIRSYIISARRTKNGQPDEQGGHWFQVLVGAEKKDDPIREKRAKLGKRHRISEAKIKIIR
ncbi:MAG: SPOR domain-containing protein, partial [Myxococcota bacterium]|nr:SPOR domain-containing protein [Myxococcota bacterium]